ncbi:MAG: dienelactone hydrolase family protein [Chloroflexi bacterium]|nr:dienelactone hydrolase family protein [Chloroflexota bacterium]
MRLVRSAAIRIGAVVLGLALLLALSVAVDYALGANRILDVTNVEVPGSGDGSTLRAYVARPSQGGPRPIILMIHEFYGLNGSITGKADLLAREGYFVVAVDTFRGSTTSWIPRAIIQTITANPEVVNRDIDAVARWAKAQPGADPSRVAILGFCYGGRTSLLYTLHNPSVAATVVFYGNPETDAQKLKVIKGPVLGIFGGADASIPSGRVDAFRAGLQAAGVPGRVTVYDGQPHGFVVDAAGVQAGGAQAQAWSEMVRFLRESLVAPRAGLAAGDERAASSPTALSQVLALAIEHLRSARSHVH